LSELPARPLEPMIPVTKAPGRQRFKLGVVLHVGRGHDHGRRPGKFEQDSFERRQSRLVEMFDDLHDRRRVEAAQALVAITERAVDELDPLALPLGQAIEVQTLAGDLQGAVRDVEADDALEPFLSQEPPEEIAVAATQVQHPLGVARAERSHDGVQSLLVQADLAFDLLFFRSLPLVGVVDVRGVLVE